MIVVTREVLEKMQQHYDSFLVNAPAHAIFMAKKGNVTITAYSSGKVLFQGGGAEKEASQWNTNTNEAYQNKAPSNSSLPKDFYQHSHIGSDETGTGDYFGPVTVAAVYIPEDSISIMKQLGVTDSKVLHDNRITDLAKEIVALDIPYSLLTLDNKKYNQLQRNGWNQGKIKAMLHHHAIHNVLKKIKDAPLEGILIDQFCQPSVYKKYIATENLSLHKKTYFMTKAESYSTAVAAASIIARSKFVKEMDALSEKMGITLPKGASKKVDETAAYLIKNYGMDALESIAKLHFGNTEKAKNYLS